MSIEQVQLSVGFSIERLKIQLASYLDKQYPGNHPGPEKWLDVINGLITTAEARLFESQSDQADDTKRRLIQDALQICYTAYGAFDYLKGSDIEELPYSIVAPLQRWFDKLNIDNDILFRTELVANYELTRSENEFQKIRKPSDELKNATNAICWPHLRVTVPSKAFSQLPHMAIVAHEIGHTLFEKVNLTPDIQDAFLEETNDLFIRVCAELKIQSLDTSTIDSYQKIFSSWCEELAADAFAHFLCGPAFFFALSDFFQLFGHYYGLCPTHPASDLRRHILYKKLDEVDSEGISFATIFEKHSGCLLTPEFNSASLMRTPEKIRIIADAMINHDVTKAEAHLIAELHDSIPKVVETIYSNVHSHLESVCPDAIYKPSDFDADLNSFLMPMLSAIPPIEMGARLEDRRPTDFSTILNVGWVTLLTKLDELKVRSERKDRRTEKLEKLHQILLKAVELSEAKRRWMEIS